MGLRVAASFDHGIMDPVVHRAAHAASGEEAADVAPGQILSIFGNWLGPQDGVAGSVDERRRVRPEAGGVQVWFDEVAAPILYASRSQVNFVAPVGLRPGTRTRIVVRNEFQSALPLDFRVATVAPALFTMTGTGRGAAAAINQDGTLNTESSPAPRGSVVSLFGSGFGALNSPVLDGEVVSGRLARLTGTVRVEIAGVQAGVEYAGQAPEAVAGLVQLKVRIGPDSPTGAQPVTIQVGDRRTRTGVTLFIS